MTAGARARGIEARQRLPHAPFTPFQPPASPPPSPAVRFAASRLLRPPPRPPPSATNASSRDGARACPPCRHCHHDQQEDQRQLLRQRRVACAAARRRGRRLGCVALARRVRLRLRAVVARGHTPPRRLRTAQGQYQGHSLSLTARPAGALLVGAGPALAASNGVSFAAPAPGASVSGPVHVEMAVRGMAVKPAGEAAAPERLRAAGGGRARGGLRGCARAGLSGRACARA